MLITQPPIIEDHLAGFTLSTDQKRLDIQVIHNFLSGEAYWCRGIPRAVVEKAIAHSLCFGVFADPVDDMPERQAGFARVSSDYATYAYLCDVFILPEYRERGLGKWLIGCIMRHPDLQGLRRWSLAPRDAHSLYARFGFQPVTNPERLMAIVKQNPYQAGL